MLFVIVGVQSQRYNVLARMTPGSLGEIKRILTHVGEISCEMHAHLRYARNDVTRASRRPNSVAKLLTVVQIKATFALRARSISPKHHRRHQTHYILRVVQ